MYSARLDWSVGRNPIAELLDEKRREGVPILDLTQSNPTQAGIAYPARDLAAAFADERMIQYDPTPFGLLPAREVVSAYYAERGIAVDPARILLTASTSEAYAYLFKLLADPGDEILAPRPSYPLFEYLAKLESVRMVEYPLFYDHGWHMDLARLEALVGPRTRAIVVVNPNNPTGSYVKRGEFERLLEICRKRDLALISDEVFSDYALSTVPSMDRVTTVASAEGVVAFALNGLSKIVGLPQMKLGWIVTTDARSLERLELIADSYLSVGTPVQVALPRLMALHHGIQRQIADRTKANLELLRGSIAPDSHARLLDVEGGWYAILHVPRVRTEEEWVLDLLRERNVLVQPGYFYDFESEAYMVISLLTESRIFRQGLGEVCQLVSASVH